MHHQARVGRYCTIGTCVTLGAAPQVGNHVYIATGARLVGVGTSIGDFSIIGANAVVVHDVPPFSIVAGVPGRVVGQITAENLDSYLRDYLCAAGKSDDRFVARMRDEIIERLKSAA